MKLSAFALRASASASVPTLSKRVNRLRAERGLHAEATILSPTESELFSSCTRYFLCRMYGCDNDEE